MAATGATRDWRQEEEPEDFGIPLAPLVDIVFLLLVFFLLETTFLDEEKDLTLALPRTAAGKSTEGERLQRVLINIRSDGTILLGSRTTSREDLFKALVEARRANAEIPVILRGDKSTSHGEIVSVLSVCQRARIRNVAVAVQNAESDPSSEGESSDTAPAER